MPSRYLPRQVAVVAVCLGAIAAVGAAPALATTQSEAIFANGSSLQKVAQLGGTNGAGFIWAGWAATWHSTASDRTTLSCAVNPAFPNPCTSTYTSTSSGSGLAEFGNAGSASSCPGSTDAVLDMACDATADNGSTNGYGVPVLDAWVGSDDPPTTTNLANATTAAGGASPIHEITVPVAQAPVAIVLSLPAGLNIGCSGSPCKFGTVHLTNALLQHIFDTTVPAKSPYAAHTWGALLRDAGLQLVASNPASNQFTDSGGAGNTAITLQARSSSSGTSYTIKGFLNLSGDPNYTSAFVVDDPTWPVTTEQCNESPSNCPFGSNTGGGTLVKNVAGMPGSIGYANLADAAETALGDDVTCPPGTQFGYTNLAATVNCVAGKAVSDHQVLYAQVQDNQGSTPFKFASPAGAFAGTANVYTGSNISINGSSGVGHWIVPEPGGVFDPTGSWGGTNPSDPKAATDAGTGAPYPIVAATYDLGWDDYIESGSNLVGDFGGSVAQAIAAGASAASYLQYEVSSTKGQANLTAGKQYYTKLPAAIDSLAVTAASRIDTGS